MSKWNTACVVFGCYAISTVVGLWERANAPPPSPFDMSHLSLFNHLWGDWYTFKPGQIVGRKFRSFQLVSYLSITFSLPLLAIIQTRVSK